MRRKSERAESKQQKQGPPLQFRPGVELERLVDGFASQHSLGANEACKVLIALSVTGLDCRYWRLMHRLAEAMEGTSGFVHACVHVENMLKGAALATGRALWQEPERSFFILKIVREYLASKGLQIDETGLWFLGETQGQEEEAMQPIIRNPSRRRRKIRKVHLEDQEAREVQDAMEPERQRVGE